MTAPSWATWRRPVRTLALALIRFYQKWVSPALPPSCRFYPTCSAYAMTAIERFGPLTGTRLAAWRLLRCNPWNPGGVDHVPTIGPDGRPDHSRTAEIVYGSSAPDSDESPRTSHTA